MTFSVRRPQYFISHTKSHRLLLKRHRLSQRKHTRDVRELGTPVIRVAS